MAATRSWETQQRLQALNAAVRERDCFNIPPGTGTAFATHRPGNLLPLSASDRPLVEALRLYREES